MNVVDLAWQVIEMQRTIDAQERQITRLMRTEEDYIALLESSTAHGRAMMGNVLELCMTPGVVEACQAAAEAGPAVGSQLERRVRPDVELSSQKYAT